MTHQPEPTTTLPDTWSPAVRDAFWTAVNAPTYEESAAATLAFAQLLPAAVSAAVAPPTQAAAEIRDQLLHAIDHAYTTGVLGYTSPEDLLAAYDTSRTPATTEPADRAALRETVAEALMQWAEGNNSPKYASMRRPATVVQNAYSRADAVLAVLPQSVEDRVRAVCDQLLRSSVLADGQPHTDRERGVVQAVTRILAAVDGKTPDAELRRMADETATETPTPSLRERHRAAWHALTPAEQTARITELDANDEPTTGARQDGTQPCAECGDPKTTHREGDDPVSPGYCSACPDDDAWHDYRPTHQDGTQP